MIRDIQPVADLLAIAVHRQRFARECIDDHQRNEFFRKMVRPVVVRAVRRDDGQTIGVVPSTHKMVTRRLTRRVRAVGLVRIGFGKGRISRLQTAVDLIRAHVVKTEGALFGIA